MLDVEIVAGDGKSGRDLRRCAAFDLDADEWHARFLEDEVEFSAIGEATWLVTLGLLIGKPVGIFLFGWFAANVLRLGLPVGMDTRDLVVVGCVAAIGFTVALFVASVAFPAGDIQDAAKMGALFSFGASVISLIVGAVLRVQKVHQTI